MPTAIVTGASRGLGLALADSLAGRGWRLVIDARDGVALERAAAGLRARTEVVALAGDVADAAHRGRSSPPPDGAVDLLVNNASTLGASPLPPLSAYPLDELEQVYRTNALAPLALMQAALPRLAEGARIVNVTSDAAVEPYEGWGGYGSSKAALEQLTAVFAAEQPQLRVYAVDPGDMNTRMHQDAYPGRGHLRPPGAGAERPGPARADRGRPPERALLGRRAGGGAGVSAAPAFALPPALEASEPPEARGLRRDQVRLMVVGADAPPAHARFLDLPRFLRPGDLLVVNESATLPAALAARRSDGTAVDLHLSTPDPGDPERWIVELRRDGARFRGARCGERLELAGGGRAELVAPYLSAGRLWIAALELPAPLLDYLDEHGSPIRYSHQPRDWPLADHQTIFARVPGSAEMPSAGRPFTPRVLARLGARVGVAPLLLHTGVSSQERGERPYPERFRVPAATAARVNAARAAGGRVIAVGTTVTRALETVAAPDGTVAAGAGWTSLTITPERGVRAVDGLITGWHEPDASHLLLLEAVGGRTLVERSYAAALAGGYRWHEFGDSHLLLGTNATRYTAAAASG